MLCPMGPSAFQTPQLLQNLKAAAPQGSRNGVPHTVPGYRTTSQQTVLHILLQLQTLFREKVLGRAGVLQATEVLGFARRRSDISRCLLSPSQTRGLWNYFAFFGALTPEQKHLPSVWFNLVIPKYGVFHLQNHTLLYYRLLSSVDKPRELHLSSQLQSAARCTFLREPTHFRKSYSGSICSLAFRGAGSSPPAPAPPPHGLPGSSGSLRDRSRSRQL